MNMHRHIRKFKKIAKFHATKTVVLLASISIVAALLILPASSANAFSISEFFGGAGNFLAAIGRIIPNPFANLFGGDDNNSTDVAGRTPADSDDSLSELTVESGNLASVGEVAAPIIAPAPLPAPTPAPSPVPVSVPIPVPDADPVPTDEGVDDPAPVEESGIEQEPAVEVPAPEPIEKKFDLPSPRRAPVPPVVSIQNGITFNAVSDTNSEEDGNQIILSGTSEPALIAIKIRPTYTVTTTVQQGTWSKEVTLVHEGENHFTVTGANYVGEGRPTKLLINLDSIAPTSTIAVSDYKIDETEFKISWSTDATDLDYYEVEYKIGNAGAWQDWGSATTTETDKDYKDAISNTYHFRVRGIDIHQNIGEWKESAGVIIDLTSPIVINEIQLADAEFVELYNAGSENIDLDEGYYFSYYLSTSTDWTAPHLNRAFPEDAKIFAGGYFLIGIKDYPESGGSPDADWQILTNDGNPYTTGLLDPKGTVAIFPFDPTSATSSQHAYDNRIDVVGWGSGISLYEQSPATTIPAVGESLTRDSSHVDSENNSTDFTVAASTTPRNSAGDP